MSSDIFSLVEFFEKCSFFQAVKKICNWIDLDYYSDPDGDLPESLKITKMLIELSGEGNSDYDDDKPLKPISESILSYYHSYVNDLFLKDNIDYETQRTFEIGYDEQTDRITIPIRDELGTLVGIKGRYFFRDVPDTELKYLYIEPVNRSKILYGLYLTYPYIQRQRKVYVGEAEKSVMQLWNMGICNAVATGGKRVSNSQIDKLTRLCADVVFLFDKDVDQDELEVLCNRFQDSVSVYAIIDNKGILNEKESPTDDPEKFHQLLNECMIRLK